MRRMAILGSALAMGMVLTLAGCGGGDAHSPQDAHVSEDSVTIILSKYYQSRNYRNWLGRLAEDQGMPPLRFVQAYGMDEEDLQREIDQSAAIVLTGGEDVHPGRYGASADTIHCGTIDEERDRVELILLDRILSDTVPCLGVCRGLQIMNVHGGGSLYSHLPDAGFTGHWGGTAGNTKDTLHPVLVTSPWDFEDQSFGPDGSLLLVSHHHQGIDRLAATYASWAVSPGGLIEAIRYRDTVAAPFVVGVQWHPERSSSHHALTDGLGLALLKATGY